jgi:hypothetical protein
MRRTWRRRFASGSWSGWPPDDTVSIVTYAGSAGTVLEPTKASEKTKILVALDGLSAGGSTAGAEGIRQAYNLAERNFDKAGVNRVILATDGDFNVGISDPRELQDFVERKRQSGVYLSVLGFGAGNYNDELMQALAQTGNGNAAYIDSLGEARKVLVDEATSTLFPIANDVKIQVEFNPAAVSEYRLIGYETRLLDKDDFNNDKVDAGDIGAGHTVTALYEVTPKGSRGQRVDPLRYGTAEQPGSSAGEYAFVKIRYKLRLLRSYTMVKRLRQDFPWFRKNEQVIMSALNLGVFIFIMTALVYETQHFTNPKIGNYADALYFTVTALTTTGFGDVVLEGTGGRMISVIIMIFGVSLFLRLVQVMLRPDKVFFKCPDCGLSRHDRDAVHCKACGRLLNIPDEGAV